VDQRTVRALNQINRSFYRRAADEFDASRNHPWPGWWRLLEHIHSESDGEPGPAAGHPPDLPIRVLDVGCGNGRFVAFLADQLTAVGGRLDYTGLDSSSRLLARARERSLPIARCRWIEQDLIETLLDESPSGVFRVGVAGEPSDRSRYQLIALFGVLHHVPSDALRARLLRRLGEQLAERGVLALTCWQFAAFARFEQKIIGWDDYNRTAAEPVDTSQLEAGDHLLPWSDDAELRRYCHFTDESEIQRLLDRHFEIVDSFSSDGRTGDLNRYFICRYRGPGTGPKGEAETD